VEPSTWRARTPAIKSGRIVILNKIDGLWDDLKSDDEIEREIDRQVRTTAAHARHSARPGVRDVRAEGAAREGQRRRRGCSREAACRRSKRRCRTGSFPRSATSSAPRSQAKVRSLARACARSSTRALAGRHRAADRAHALRGKNQDVVGHMMERVRNEKELFERGPRALHRASQRVHAADQRPLDHIGLAALRANAGARGGTSRTARSRAACATR
jgi:hypothetical protein